jgi:hypothetical protein
MLLIHGVVDGCFVPFLQHPFAGSYQCYEISCKPRVKLTHLVLFYVTVVIVHHRSYQKERRKEEEKTSVNRRGKSSPTSPLFERGGRLRNPWRFTSGCKEEDYKPLLIFRKPAGRFELVTSR